MLRIHNLQKEYNKPVIRNFSYAFEKKGLYLLRGESGVGKTTLFRLIAGLEKADSGSIEKSGKISMVFQEARLIPHLTLLENLLIVKKEPDREEALAVLRRVGLDKDSEKYPHELSGGMALRGAIARSLYFGGDIFLWDEPTKELDPDNRERVIALAKELSQTKLVIAITHDPAFTGGIELLLQ
jgi:ABC-type multidrug transport system ATPase subunit